MKESEVLNHVFHALSDPTRRELLDKLSQGEYTISELAEPFRMTLAAVSKHIRVLEEAGLIKRKIDGRIHRCRADLDRLQSASEFIDRYRKYWEGRLDVLDAYFKKTGKK